MAIGIVRRFAAKGESQNDGLRAYDLCCGLDRENGILKFSRVIRKMKDNGGLYSDDQKLLEQQTRLVM